MLHVRLCVFLFAVMAFANACTPIAAPFKPALEREAEIIVYLQPLPQEAHRLRFSFSAINAVTSDGAEYPLSMELLDVKGDEAVEEQRRLASAIVPPGTYEGLSFTIGKASVQTEEGEVALLVPEEPVMVAHKFSISERKALALFIEFHPEKSITDTFRFTPIFSVKTFGRELINLIGFVSNTDANNITIFNKNAMQVTGVLATRQGPREIALDQERRRAYVALSGSDAVEIIDVFRGEIISSIALNIGDEPRELALTPDGGTLVTANYRSGTLSVIDASSMFELRRAKVGEGPASVVMGPLGVKAYVMDSFSNAIHVVELSRREPTTSIALEESPYRGDLSSGGDRLFVITLDSPNLLVVDTSTLAVTDKIFIGPGARSIKVDSRTDLVYVGMDSGGIYVIDPSSLIFIDRIPVEGGVGYLAIDSEENALFALVPEEKKLLKLNFVSKRVISAIEVGEGAYAVVIMGER